MKIKKLIIIGTMLTLSSLSYASESNNLYLKLSGNINLPTDTEKGKFIYKGEKAFGGAVALGYAISPQFNVEAAFNYIHNFEYKMSLKDIDDKNSVKSKIGIIAPTLNAYYIQPFNDSVSGYIGAGAGAAFLSPEDSIKLVTGKTKTKTKPNETSFAAKGMVGVLFNMNQISLDVGYNFGYYGESDNIALKAHTGTVGIKYSF